MPQMFNNDLVVSESAHRHIHPVSFAVQFFLVRERAIKVKDRAHQPFLFVWQAVGFYRSQLFVPGAERAIFFNIPALPFFLFSL